MEQYTSEDARKQWRRILNEAERGERVGITRYGKRLAVVVPAAWYDAAIGYIGLNAEEELPGDWHVLTDSVREARREAGFPEGYEQE